MGTDQIIDRMLDTLDGAFGEGAATMAGELFSMLGEQAAILPGSSPPRAAERATPGAVPRRVSGWLQSHVGFDRLGKAEWVFGVRRDVPYAPRLEYETAHPYFSVLVDQSLGDLVALVSDRVAGGR